MANNNTATPTIGLIIIAAVVVYVLYEVNNMLCNFSTWLFSDNNKQKPDSAYTRNTQPYKPAYVQHERSLPVQTQRIYTPYAKSTARQEWEAKKNAHEIFDQLWQTGKTAQEKKKLRVKAYKWLAKKLNKNTDDTHMSKFDIPTCKKVVLLCEERLRNEREKQTTLKLRKCGS